MRPLYNIGATAVLAFGVINCAGSGQSAVVPAAATLGSSSAVAASSKVQTLSARAMAIGVNDVAVCAPASETLGTASCHALKRTDVAPNPNAAVSQAAIAGLRPADLQAAYGLSAAAATGTGQTVAVIVANDNPALASDLAVYRKEFNLPACTVASGCLQFVYQGKVKPSSDASWAAESNLDVQMVSAICRQCHIIVAEAKSDKISDLSSMVGQAVDAGATVVSNSYAIPEDAKSVQVDSAYDRPGIPMTAGAGDSGYGVSYPASSRYVTAVGGTSLHMSGGAVSSETVWGATGSGCSQYVPKPTWQHDAGCHNRTVNDVAVVADPDTGVAMYSSVLGGWNVFGGTSLGAPIVASMYALAGNGKSISGAASLYSHPSSFRSISGGSAGSCASKYLCIASTGYNGPAGLGTPLGLSAF